MAEQNEDSLRGLAVAAYVMWRYLPYYIGALAHEQPADVVAHPLILIGPVAAAILLTMRRAEAASYGVNEN